MPPIKGTKCTQKLAAMKKKKFKSPALKKEKSLPIISDQRFHKSKTINQVIIEPQRGTASNEGGKPEEEDPFVLNPAYLCECSLEIQDTPSASKSVSSVNHPSKNISFKNINIRANKNNRGQDFNPAYLCESILQSSNTSKVLPTNYLNVEDPKNNLLGGNAKRKRKIGPNGKVSKTSDINYSQVFSPFYLCESVLQSENNSDVTELDISKENSCKKKFLRTKPLREKKIQCKSREVKNSGLNKQSKALTPAFLCEIKSEVVKCDTNHPKVKCLKNKRHPVKEKKQKMCGKDSQSTIVINQKRNFSSQNLAVNILQSNDVSVTLKSNPLKDDGFKTISIENNKFNQKKQTRKSKTVTINEVNSLYKIVIPTTNRKGKLKSSLVISELKHSNIDSSKIIKLKRKPKRKKTINGKSKKRQNKNNKNLEQSVENPVTHSKSTSQSDNLLESNHLKEENCQSELNKNCNEKHSLVSQNENPLWSESNLVMSESVTEVEPSSKKIDIKNDPKENELLCSTNQISWGRKIKSNMIIDDSISGGEETSVALMPNPSTENVVENQLPDDSLLSNDEQLLVDIEKYSGLNNNDHDTFEEIGFIECTTLNHDPKQSSTEFITNEIVSHEIFSEVDPLECESPGIDHLNNIKNIDNKEGHSLESYVTLDKGKEALFTNATEVEDILCNLNLECSSEDLETDLKYTDWNCCGSDDLESDNSSDVLKNIESNSIKRFSFSNVEIECDSAVLLPFFCSLKLVNEAGNVLESEESEVTTKKLTNVIENNLLKSDDRLMESVEIKHSSSKINQSPDDHLVELEDNPKTENNLHCDKSESDLLLSQVDRVQLKRKQTHTIENSTPGDDSSESLSTKRIKLTEEPEKLGTMETLSIETGPSPSKSTTHDNMKQEEVDSGSTFSGPFEICPLENHNKNPEMLPPTSIENAKQTLNLNEKRDLRVLLCRLEDEKVFQLWKKDGVISPRKHSSLKQYLKVKNLHSLISSGKYRKKKHYKCFACKKSFKDRERYWEHRASKCDRIRIFACDNCSRKYILRKMLVEHRRKCILNKYFSCKTCLKDFNDPERLEEHIASKCDTQKAFHCDVCGRGFIFKRLLLIHTTPICTSLRRYKCSICHQFFRKDNLKKHVMEHKTYSDYAVLCEFCGKLVGRKHWREHMNIHLAFTDASIYRCKFCRGLFKTKQARDWHKQSHYDSKPCSCADCGKIFQRLIDLEQHVSGYGYFSKCKICEKVILNQYCYHAHIKRHFKDVECSEVNLKYEIKQEPDDKKISQFVDEKPFRCSDNEKIFSEVLKLEPHSQDMHKINLPVGAEENKTYSNQGSASSVIRRFNCDKCSNTYSRRFSLTEHQRKTHGILKITTANKNEPNKTKPANEDEPYNEIKPINEDKPYNETKLVHEDKPFLCKVCGNVFAKKKNLSRHCQRVHGAPSFKKEDIKTATEARPYGCDICGSHFGNQENLRKHCRRMHQINVSGSYSCNFCLKKFQTVNLLKEHTFQHFKDCFVIKSENPLVGADFNVKAMNQERCYICDICCKYFGNKRNLSAHRSRVHFKKLFKNDSSSNRCVETVALMKDHKVSGYENVEEVKPNFEVSDIKEEENLFSNYDLKQSVKASTSSGYENQQNLIKAPELLGNVLENNRNNMNQERCYICDICCKSFGNKRNLSAHRSRVHFKKLFKNDSSSNRCVETVALMKDHKVSGCENVEEEKPGFEVADIKKEENLFSNYDLKQSVKASTSSEYENQQNLIKAPELLENVLENNRNNMHDQKSTMFACRECGMTFTTEYDGKNHVCHHKINNPQTKIGQDIHRCQECGVVFFDKFRLNRHLLSHSSQIFKCDICKKSFNSQLKLNVHLLVHGIKTNSAPTFKCLICNKQFPTSEKLKKHSILHTNQNPYQCTKCDIKYTASFSLRRHNMRVHSDKRFSCNYCNMCFFSFSSLNQHVMYVHKRAVSLTEYVLKIDDEMLDGTLSENDNPSDCSFNNKDQGKETTENNLQPQLFANVNNMFMFSNLFNDLPMQKSLDLQEDVVNPTDFISGATEKEEAVNLSTQNL